MLHLILTDLKRIAYWSALFQISVCTWTLSAYVTAAHNSLCLTYMYVNLLSYPIE